MMFSNNEVYVQMMPKDQFKLHGPLPDICCFIKNKDGEIYFASANALNKGEGPVKLADSDLVDGLKLEKGKSLKLDHRLVNKLLEKDKSLKLDPDLVNGLKLGKDTSLFNNDELLISRIVLPTPKQIKREDMPIMQAFNERAHKPGWRTSTEGTEDTFRLSGLFDKGRGAFGEDRFVGVYVRTADGDTVFISEDGFAVSLKDNEHSLGKVTYHQLNMPKEELAKMSLEKHKSWHCGDVRIPEIKNYQAVSRKTLGIEKPGSFAANFKDGMPTNWLEKIRKEISSAAEQEAQ
jgi:hypothetical protein